MAGAPNLVIQLQRMGDLVLSFPLISWLARLEPDHPVWVVAEPSFSDALMPLAPDAVFFPPEAAARLEQDVSFHRVINLSHRPDAARLAGSVRSESLLGAWSRGDETRVRGAWSLYRASLVHNNRHNRLHWADLDALDAVDPHVLRRSVWPEPRRPEGGRVGLFVGASETAKRPDPLFWATLAERLLRRGHRPVFLGGTAEAASGEKAARLAGLPLANLCGRFRLDELVRFMRELDLLVTPDTGPMHVGAWAGALTLNLSMGPVNAWETAPFPPGHFVLRPSASCTGCWRCTRPDNAGEPPCKKPFVPERVASLVHALLRGDPHLPALPGLHLLQTRRSSQGLFDLTLPSGELLLSPRAALGEFWKQWFLDRLGGPPGRLEDARRQLAATHPVGSELLRKALPRFQARVAGVLRSRALPSDFWRQAPPLLRPLSGYLQMDLENSDFSREAWRHALESMEHLAATLSAS